jgi:hypothetical protein
VQIANGRKWLGIAGKTLSAREHLDEMRDLFAQRGLLTGHGVRVVYDKEHVGFLDAMNAKRLPCASDMSGGDVLIRLLS